MSSSWSEIRSRANDDPLLHTISDLQAKANMAEAIKDITTSDKVSPIRIIRSKVEVLDRNMMTGYARPLDRNKTFYMPKEPDGEHLRLDVKFDSACDTLNDYSMMGNDIQIGYNDTLPVLLKATEDDGITAGDMVSVVDGRTQYHRIPVTDAISIKKMVTDGKPGITIIYRHFPLFINSEAASGTTQRATPLYMIENDQVEYAVKWEVDDAGYIYFFFRHQFINYYVRSTEPQLTPPDIPDYYSPDYSTTDYETAEEYYNIAPPISYIDLAMEFNFTTHAITMFINSVPIAVTTVGVDLVPALPAPIFPPAFADPPPPPEQPEPYFLPFTPVYTQPNETLSLKVNAVTTTTQQAFYNIPGKPAQTDPIKAVYNIQPVPENLWPGNEVTPDPDPDPDPDPNGGGGGEVVVIGEVPDDYPDYEDNGIVLNEDQRITGMKITGNAGLAGQLIGKSIYHVRGIVRYEDEDAAGRLFCRVWNSAGQPMARLGQKTEGLDVAAGIAGDQEANDNGHFGAAFTTCTPPYVIKSGDVIGFEYVPGGSDDEIEIVGWVDIDEEDPDTFVGSLTTMVAEASGSPFVENEQAFHLVMRFGEESAGGPITPPIVIAPAGDSGSTDIYGVKAAYATGPIRTDYTEDFKSDSMRWDFEEVGANNYVSCELIGYFRSSSPVEDEVSGIMGGGLHGDEPRSFSLGVDTESGDTRWRYEEFHPEYEDGEDGGQGVPLGDNWVGYKFIKWNKTDHILLEIWQDQGNNEGSTPANQWTQIASWQVTDPLWFQPPADHQETLRIDGNFDDLEFKWLSLRQIEGADTGSGGGGGGNPQPTPTDFDTWPSSTILCNNINFNNIAGQLFAQGVGMIGSIPTLIEINMWRNDAATSGSYHIRLYNAAGQIKKTFYTGSVANLPNTIQLQHNIIWQDIANDVPILENDKLVVEVEGVINAARVYVMNNKKNRGTVTGGTEVPGGGGGGGTEDTYADPIISPISNPLFIDRGGTKYSGTTVHFIFWGSTWNSRTTPFSRQQLVDKINIIFASKYFDHLYQYDRIKRPKVGTVAVNTSSVPNDEINSDMIYDLILSSISQGLVPDNPPNGGVNSYYVFLPPGVDIVNDFHGFHTYRSIPHDPPDPTKTKKYVFGTGRTEAAGTIWSNLSDINFSSALMTTELVEMMTDPFGSEDNRGIMLRSGALDQVDGTEIGDLCEKGDGFDLNQFRQLPNTTAFVSSWYSDQDGGCIVRNNDPTWLSCPTGFTYQVSSQQCFKPGTPSTGGGGGGGTTGTTAVLVPAQPSNALIKYRGGYVFSNARVHFIFSGSDWDTRSSPFSKAQLVTKLQALFASKYFDGLIQYGVKRPTLGTIVTNTEVELEDDYDVTDLYAVLDDSITRGLVPGLTQGVYNMYFFIQPVGITGGWATPIGYHTWRIPGAIVDPTTDANVIGVMGTRPSLNEATVTISHELAEMLTNPFGTATGYEGWESDTSPPWTPDPIENLICDWCEQTAYPFVNGVNVHTYYSNQDATCIATTAKPAWVSCPTGYVYNEASQVCVGTGTGTGTGTTTPTNSPPILATPPSNFMKKYSDVILSGATIHFIFWGEDWEDRESPFSMADIMSAVDLCFQSKVWDNLIQYGIKRPVKGKVVINTTYPDVEAYTLVDMRECLFDSIARGQVPDQSADMKQFWMVMPSMTQDVADEASQQGIGGFHTMSWRPGQTTPSPWRTVHPLLGQEVLNYPWGMVRSVFSFSFTIQAITHEIVEGISDPRPYWDTLGVYANVPSNDIPGSPTAGSGVIWKEMCDMVPGYDFTGSGWMINEFWSNQHNGGFGRNEAPTFISCPTGKTWNAALQECVGSTTGGGGGTGGGGTVIVGGTYSNDFDGERSCLTVRKVGSTTFEYPDRTVDATMRVRRGGGEFTGYIELDSRRKRVGAKANQPGSILIDKVISKIELTMKRVGAQLTGNIECNIRDQNGNLRMPMGVVDASTINLTNTPVSFINTQHTYTMALGDVVSVEYNNAGGGTTDPDPIVTTLTNPVIPAQPATQGMIYHGGPVYSAPKVYFIFDGTAWDNMTTPFSKAQFIAACDIVFNSQYFDFLLQYGAKKPSLHSYMTNTTATLPSTYNRSHIQALINDSKTRGLVPSNIPTSQHNIYIVMVAPNKTFQSTDTNISNTARGLNAAYWTTGTEITETATVYAGIMFKNTDTLNRITNTVFHELVELMVSPINLYSQTGSPNAWHVNPAVLSTTNGMQIADPGEGLTPTIGGSGGVGEGGGGVLDTHGVRSTYGTGDVRYDYVEDFKTDSYRWDFESVGANNFVSMELTGYFRSANPPDDEVSGIVGGGTHGDNPRSYSVGIDTITGATRYRMEEFHPEYEDGETGPSGEGMRDTFIGYRWIKWNQPDGVRLEIWQDLGNNEGSTPANEWELVASWTESDYNWQQPPSDHQETIRIDGDNLEDIEFKWLSIREILPTDTETGGTGGGGTGVEVAAYYSNLNTSVVPPPEAPTWISCASGTGTYDPVLQMCKITTGGTGGGAGPSDNYLMVRAANGFFNGSDASKTMMFESVLPNINFQSTMYDRDLAGIMYTGGRMDLAARPLRGVKVASVASVLYDKVITEVRLKLKGTGILPLGHIIRVKIIRGSDKVTMRQIGDLDFNSISTTHFIEYYFQNPENTYRMKVGDYVALEFNSGNSVDTFLQVRVSGTDIYDGINTIMFESNGKTYSENVDWDISGSMSIGGYTVTPDPIAIPPVPPFHYAHEWFISASAPEDSLALAQPSTLAPKTNSHYNNIAKEFRIYDFLLTEGQLQNYYENRFTITPLPKGTIEVVGHDYVPYSS